MTATEFRQRLYQVLGELADSGGNAIITHRNRTFLVVPKEQPVLTERLIPHNTLLVDSEELVDAEMPGWEWDEERNLGTLS